MRIRFRLVAGALLFLLCTAILATHPELRYFVLGKLLYSASPAALVEASEFDWRRVDVSREGTAWIDDVKALVQSATEHPECIALRSSPFQGSLCATRALEGPYSDTQSGFRNFFSTRYPDANLFEPLGWNFEHILSTVREDYYRNDFSPRIEQCFLLPRSPTSAALFWPGEHGEWPFASEMVFSLGNESAIDIEFRTSLLRPMPRELVIMMWASYMRCARERAIHFWGAERDPYHPRHYGNPGWITFGNSRDALGGKAGGNVPYFLLPKIEEVYGEELLNAVDTPDFGFLLPVYYGRVDGACQADSAEDDMVYIMMFDQAEPIRLTMYGFNEDPGKPAWDWQYRIPNPEKDRTYGYRARCVYKPFVSQEDVLAEYTSWRKTPPENGACLAIEVVPDDAGAVFPPDVEGCYAAGSMVHFGVQMAEGWQFDHWEGGEVLSPATSYTGVRLTGPTSLKAMLKPR